MSIESEICQLETELAATREIERQTVVRELLKASFSCTKCSKCCRGAFGDNAVAVFPSEVRRIMAASGRSWFEVAEPPESEDFDAEGNRHAFEWTLRRRADGDCVFLDGGRCSVYEDRPHICRTYPFRLAGARVESYECEGLGTLSPKPAGLAEIAEALVSRQICELEETILLLQRFEPFEQGEPGDGCCVIVHDSEGSKPVRKSGDHQYAFLRPDE